MKQLLVLVVISGLVFSANAFDVSKCITADNCYKYCLNAVKEYKNGTMEQTEIILDYYNKTSDKMKLIEARTNQERLLIISLVGTGGGIVLGAVIVLWALKKYPLSFVEVKQKKLTEFMGGKK